ncbi:SGNH/GDSL hydrolase family protein [Cohnella sp. JJ-181]|uniref:SGNH/GDSL hydrolase family protein n=1 Tax=Cohnella rhizoplanae TaxID=2974897 RepID=UPI0022FF7A04|nr:SGNH/GDSL hydrolase family protein [Cohnella sp. JJ-181]CAI6037460.1 hypothetical protein COHCIP112018_00949 [Cohnella sp. JJ-181]
MELAKWRHKRWGTLGDSITAANGYQPIVAAALQFAEVLNYGKSGCPMTAGGPTDEGSTWRMAQRLAPGLDCVTIFAGTNDYRLDKPLGGPDSRDPHTFAGAYRTAVETVLTAVPGCRLSLWTPLQRDKDGYDIVRPNAQGHRLSDYADAVRALGREYALPVLDLYGESGLNKLTLPWFTDDGLHPNARGHARIAEMAIPFLMRI